MKKYIFFFILMFLCYFAISEEVIRHLLKPSLVNNNDFFVMEQIYHPDYGNSPKELVFNVSNSVEYLSCALLDNPKISINLYKGDLIVESFIGSLKYDITNQKLTRITVSNEKNISSLPWKTDNSFSFKNRQFIIDEYGLVEIRDQIKYYCFLFSVDEYVIDKSKKNIIILSHSQNSKNSMLIKYNIKQNQFIELWQGNISQINYYNDTQILFLLNHEIVLFDLAKQNLRKTGIIAKIVKPNSLENCVYYYSDKALNKINLNTNKELKYYNGIVDNFAVSQNEEYILYENNEKLWIFYIDDNYLVDNPLMISQNFDSYKIIDNTIFLLKTDYRSYGTKEGLVINDATELIFMEQLDMNGHPEHIILLNSDYQLYQTYIEKINNSFDFADHKLIFTWGNMKNGQCKIVDFNLQKNLF